MNSRPLEHHPSRAARMLMDGCYYRLLESVPPLRWPACKVAQCLSFAGASSWRKSLTFNAGLALGPKSSQLERTRCAFQMMGSMQRFIAEVFASRNERPEALRARVTRFEGTASYLEARSLRRGVVLAGIHMGPFEPALATLCGIERRVHVLFQTDSMPRFERARSGLRARLGVVEHHLSDGVGAWSALLDALRNDEAVLVLGDRVMPGQAGVEMKFLGFDRAVLPAGVLRLAASHGTPIVPTYSVREANGIRVWSDPYIPTSIERLTASAVATHPAQHALIASMERAIRAHPAQWMAFHELRPVDLQERRR